MNRQERIAAENDRALRLSAAMMRADVRAGEASTVAARIRLKRTAAGQSYFTVRLGPDVEGTAATLAGALISALDQVGMN